jgi:hypothetical protein
MKWRWWVVQPPPFSFMKRKINKTRGKHKHIIKSADILKKHGGGSRSKEVIQRRQGRMSSHQI